MSWGRFWLLGGMSGLTSEEYRRRVGDVRRMASQSGREVAQDERIENLCRENHELKLYIAGVLQLLVRKGTVNQAEVEELVTLVERAEADASRLQPEFTSPDLEALAAAARAAGKGDGD